MADAPFEILELIAANLSTPDVATSSRVCTNWLNPMRKYLYHTVKINSRKRFRRFFRSIQQLDNDGIPYGQHVKKLVLLDNVGLTWVEIEQLGLLCPLIELLYFHQRIWKYIPRGHQLLKSSSSWLHSIRQLPPLNQHIALTLLPTYGSRLTTLHIVLSQPTTFTIFANTPHLKELVLLPVIDNYHYQHNDNNNAVDSVMSTLLPIHPHHFRSIATFCPQLEVFKILCKIVMRFELSEEPTTTNRATNGPDDTLPPTLSINNSSISSIHNPLQTLKISFAKASINSQYSCIRSITELFPNITSLDVNFITINTFAPQQPFPRIVTVTTEQRIHTFVNLALRCRKLEELRLRGIDALLAPNQTFFETLEDVGTRLKVLEMGRIQELLIPGGNAYYLRYSKETYDMMLQTIGNSLVMLHLHTAYWKLSHVSIHISSITRSCPLLKDLKISALAFGRRLRSPIDVGKLLNKLLQLERLEINNAHVTFGSQQDNHSQPNNDSTTAGLSTMAEYKLKSFHLNRVHFTPELFTSLSHQCTQLSQISVVCSVQQQQEESIATTVTIKMPNHVFDEINLAEIYLELETSRVGYANICSLSQTNKSTWAKRDGRRYGNKSTRWYISQDHHDRRLRDKQIYEFLQYEALKTEEAMNGSAEERRQHSHYSEQPPSLAKKDYWQESMKHGRIAVECHSVAKFTFNGGCIIP
ncbi:hypothetical protein BDC45DRAFT_510304 [Circinella umbellata]|nr:hypothetical protein BDC45DRAFT_510304 [Circinella umbellata]